MLAQTFKVWQFFVSIWKRKGWSLWGSATGIALYLQSVFININKDFINIIIVLSQHLSELWWQRQYCLLFSEIRWYRNNCSSSILRMIIKIVTAWKRRVKEGIWRLAKDELIHRSCNLANSIPSKANQVMPMNRVWSDNRLCSYVYYHPTFSIIY